MGLAVSEGGPGTVRESCVCAQAQCNLFRDGLISPSPPYSGQRGWGAGPGFRGLCALTPDPSPPSTGARGGLWYF